MQNINVENKKWHSGKKKKWVSILVAFIASICLWFYIVTVENPIKETTLSDIPVTFIGMDQLQERHELIVVDNNTLNGVEITFSGRISDLNKLEQAQKDIMLQIDISRLTQPQERSYSYDMKNLVLPMSLANEDFSIVTKYPEKVEIKLEKIKSKAIEVKVENNVTTDVGYTNGILVQDISEITVEGPETVIDRIHIAKAVFERDEPINQTVEATLEILLYDKDGNQIVDPSVICSSTTVVARLPVMMIKSVPLTVTIKDGGGVSVDDVQYSLEVDEITISGDPSVVESISDVKLQPIELSEFKTNDEVVTRSIIMPEDCTNVTGIKEVDVTVSIPNKAIKTIDISSARFQKKGLPADREVNYNTTVLPVTIRANADVIDQITEDNIRVVVDFEGRSTEPQSSTNIEIDVASIFVDGVNGNAGVIDMQYSVNVDIVSILD